MRTDGRIERPDKPHTLCVYFMHTVQRLHNKLLAISGYRLRRLVTRNDRITTGYEDETLKALFSQEASSKRDVLLLRQGNVEFCVFC
jgi:hypothetical protein